MKLLQALLKARPRSQDPVGMEHNDMSFANAF